MKTRYIIGVIVGAAIGAILTYFGTDSIGAGNLLIGVVIGALVGLYFTFAATMSSGGSASGGRSGMG